MKLYPLTLFTCLHPLFFGISNCVQYSLIYNQDSKNPEFCNHICDSFSDNGRYHVWFDTFVELVLQTSIMKRIQDINENHISNIVIQRPPSIHCHTYHVNVVVETYRDSIELRTMLKALAFQIQAISHENINIILMVNRSHESFELWNPNHGLYIFSDDKGNDPDVQIGLPTDQKDFCANSYSASYPTLDSDLSASDKHIVCQLAGRRAIEVTDVWKHENRIYVSVDVSQCPHPNRQVYQLNQELKSRINLPVEVLY